MKEEWREIPGFSAYKVSSLGKVCRTLPGSGSVMGRILKPGINKDGYLFVILHGAGKPKNKYVHRLVLEAFVGPHPKGRSECNHLNANKKDNNINNLEWIDTKGNHRHAVNMGLIKRHCQKGSKNNQAKLVEYNIKQIRQLFNDGQKIKNIAHTFKVSRRTIYSIIHNQAWTHVL